MSTKHFDVVVLGTSLGALTAAALLARRSWRVLLLGHGARKPTYAYDNVVLARRPFTFLSASSPAWNRVLVELAQSQTFRRRLGSLDPMLQVLAPGLRLDVPPDADLFAREVEREFPAVPRAVEALYAELARSNALADAAFECDAVWPPGGFWERRETSSVVLTLPHLDPALDLLSEFPRESAFRAVVKAPARFASDLAGDALPPFALARLHGAWTRGVSYLKGGESELTAFLVERLRAHGGEVRLEDRASGLVVAGGKVKGVQIDGDETPVGATFVVSDLPTAPLLALARGFVAPQGDAPASVTVRENRFVMSLVVRPEGVPQPLATESFLLPAKGSVVHLHKAPGATPGTVLLVAEVLVAARASLACAREEVWLTLTEFLPFIEKHAIMCDSPHDGRPLWDFRTASARDPSVGPTSWGLHAQSIDRARLRASGGSLEAEAMVPRFHVTPTQFHGLAGEPLRTALGNVLVVGPTVLPALGQEGALLAAWGVARIITRTDRGKAKMLRDMWSKVEIS